LRWRTSWHASHGPYYRVDKITDRYRASQQRELAGPSNGNRSTDLNLPTEVCTGTAKTKEQSQRRAFNLIPIMVFNDRPTCKDRHAAELIMARRDVLHSKAEYIAADLSIAPKLFPCSPAADHTYTGETVAYRRRIRIFSSHVVWTRIRDPESLHFALASKIGPTLARKSLTLPI
jgi:hypothetical protein